MINYLLMYAAFLLGAFIYILDEIKKYENVANANPDPNIVYKKVTFWSKEKYNLIQMALYGVVSVIILPKLFGGSTFALKNDAGTELWAVPMKAALIPIQIICGWTGGKAIMFFMGKSKKELYKKVGITDGDN